MTDNYHEGIQAVAQKIIADRKGIYVRLGTQAIQYTERELCYILGAQYKILRVKNEMADVNKALDDVVDAYNYLALLYEMLAKRFNIK